ncbi:hypothetical protein C1H76_1163 [Elsinoe australis]|uniref:DUF7907 domain-containing protein n=1 Tax=Elsinoe australis TaxID=40998 RepID=A0A4U7B9M9_9PEZI|nr:hypothetical protein C1H76_1163 [Elsinoe australis]
MRSFFVLPLLTLAGLGSCEDIFADVQTFTVVTKLKPGQDSKSRFNALTLTPYYSGTPEQYDLLLMKPKQASKEGLKPVVGFLSPSEIKNAKGQPLKNLFFDWRSYPNSPEVLTPRIRQMNKQTSWAFTELSGGRSTQFITLSDNTVENGVWSRTKDGLQFNTRASRGGVQFGEWMVCEWWKHQPQLFMRIKDDAEKAPIPSSCATVWLMPKDIPKPQPTETATAT